MGKRSIAVVVFLAIISLGLITAGQVYWVRTAYLLQKSDFSNRVNIALNTVVERIHIIANDLTPIEPATEVEEDLYVIGLNLTPNTDLLTTLLIKELKKKGIVENVEYGVYDCFSSQYEIQGHLMLSTDSTQQVKAMPSGLKILDAEGHYLALYFPFRQDQLLKELDFWMYSSIVILFIIVFFSYTISVLFREKRLSTIRNDFVNNMTHELKTPLSTIALSADALSKPGMKDDTSRYTTYLNIIVSETNRLRNQVDRVLQLASLSAKKKNLELATHDMHDMLSHACEIFQLRAKERGGELDLELKAGLHFVKVDQVHMNNIIFNLLDNAIKYTEDTPHLKVLSFNQDKKLIIQVEDNGIGIPKKLQKLIFDKFYRVSTGDLHNVKGFGLGLFYVKSMVEAQKGKIYVESEQGKGAIFTLVFEAIPPEKQPTE